MKKAQHMTRFGLSRAFIFAAVLLQAGVVNGAYGNECTPVALDTSVNLPEVRGILSKVKNDFFDTYDDIPPVRVFKPLLLIKRKTKIPAVNGMPSVECELTDEQVATVRKQFEQDLPKWVANLSRGSVRWEPQVIIGNDPITEAEVHNPNPEKDKDGWVIGPKIAGKWLRSFEVRGKFDNVFVTACMTDRESGQFGGVYADLTWSSGSSIDRVGAGYSFMNLHREELSDTFHAQKTEAYLHEWLHQVESYLEDEGVTVPSLHSNADYGFTEPNGERGWKDWYEAYMNHELRGKDGAMDGLGEKAWRVKEPRLKLKQK